MVRVGNRRRRHLAHRRLHLSGGRLVGGPGAVRRHRRRHGRGERRRQPDRLEPGRRRRAHVRRRSARAGPPSTGVAGRRARRVGPGQPEEVLRVLRPARSHLSTDGGATFTASAATGLPATGQRAVQRGARPRGRRLAGRRRRRTAPTACGTRPTPARRSPRSPRSSEGDTIGFGKAAPGASYPALYTSAKIDGVRGIFRSTDAGASWVRINDDEHQ